MRRARPTAAGPDNILRFKVFPYHARWHASVRACERGHVDTAVKASRARLLRRLMPVRLIIFFCVLVAADGSAQLLWRWSARHAPGHPLVVGLSAALALGAGLIALYFVLVWALERRKARELVPGTRQGLAGVLLGFVLFSLVLGLLLAMGGSRWHGPDPHPDVIPILAVSILAAIGEEVAFRGGVFRILEDGFGTTVALVVSAAVFGLLHSFNPGATIVSTAAIALEAGVLLGAAYAFTRNLWLPIGLHLGWNFTEGGVFGASVSGFMPLKGLFSVSFAGPRWLTGGRFGPEASVVAIAVCLAAAVVLIVLTVRKGRWLPMRARMVLE